MTEIFIIDDHPIVARGIAELIKNRAQIATNPSTLGHYCDFTSLPASTNPIFIVDLELGNDINGFDIIDRIRRQSPDAKILIYTMHEEPWVKANILDLPVQGAVAKNESVETLLEAVRKIAAGSTFFSPAFNPLPSDTANSTDGKKSPGVGKKSHPSLSERERQVLKMLCDGATSEQIADSLCLSINTVQTYRRRIMDKFGVNNVARLIYQTKGLV